MLTIIITIILAMGLLIFCVNHDILEKSAPIIATAIMVLGFAIGSFIPVNGDTEWKLIEENELITLSNGLAYRGTGNICYVSLSADNAYTYRYKIDSGFGTEKGNSYKIQTLVGEDVEEVEDQNCEKAVVRVYEKEGKMSLWTLDWEPKKTKYVFYVPEGTISKEVKLK